MADDDRLCPICDQPLGLDLRRRWCSAACRQAVYRAGGRAALASIFEGHARVFESTGQRSSAAKLRDRAARLRATAGQDSVTAS